MPSDVERRALDKALDSLRAASEAAAPGAAYTCGPPWFTWNYGVLTGSPDPRDGTLIANTDTTDFEGLDRDDIDRDANAIFLAGAWNFARLILSRPDLLAALRDPVPVPERGDAGAEAMRTVLEQAAKLVETFPAEILAWYSRGPGDPPGNGYRKTTCADLAFAIRALATPQQDRVQGEENGA